MVLLDDLNWINDLLWRKQVAASSRRKLRESEERNVECWKSTGEHSHLICFAAFENSLREMFLIYANSLHHSHTNPPLTPLQPLPLAPHSANSKSTICGWVLEVWWNHLMSLESLECAENLATTTPLFAICHRKFIWKSLHFSYVSIHLWVALYGCLVVCLKWISVSLRFRNSQVSGDEHLNTLFIWRKKTSIALVTFALSWFSIHSRRVLHLQKKSECKELNTPR